MGNRTPVLIQIPLPIEGATIEIPLNHGQSVLVDAIDADLSGVLWRVHAKEGSPSYASRSEGRHTILMHRIILSRILDRELLNSERPDHENGNGLDNRRQNLRLATQRQNAQNSKIRTDNSSGYKDVVFHKAARKWMAYIYIDSKQTYLGLRDTPEDAYELRKQAELQHFGKFARII